MTRSCFGVTILMATVVAIVACRQNDPHRTEESSTTSGLAGLSAAARYGEPAARMEARTALAESARARAPQLPQMASSDSGPLGVHRPAELDQAARQIVQFLRAEGGFERIRLADTVALYLSPEGGGTRATFTRDRLRNRANWKVRGLLEYSFAPPKGAAELTTRVGRHFNCRERPLAWTFPDLARLPHVGTMLVYGTESCLQTWSATFVFDVNAQPPMLVAAVYDQFEW